MSNKNKLVCLVAVYNEEDTIRETIDALKKLDLDMEIAVINDGSTDNTKEVLESMEGINIYSYDKNRGKGYAIKYAIKRLDYDYILLIDGDLKKTSNQAYKLVEPILNNKADFTTAKFPEAKTMTNKKGGFGLVKGLAKKGVYYFTGRNIETTLSGQRVYKKEVIDIMEYIPDRYGVEIAMTIQALNAGYKLLEVPVNMSHRYTERSIKGFIHRGKQFKDILKTLIVMKIKGYRR